MFCRWCGAGIADGAIACTACGRPQDLPPPPPPGDPLDRIVAEAKRTARELADLTEKLGQKATKEAKRAADDPSDAARRAIARFQKEIEEARRDLDRALRHLK
jgi:enoyl-CoA hydratase/carnithine racemase